jgi:hypothetical protein
MKTAQDKKVFSSEIKFAPDHPSATITAVVDENGKGTIALRWNDGVVNEWEEYYDSLSLALLRLAALARCAEDGFDVFFAQGDGDFPVVGKAMLNGLVC